MHTPRKKWPYVPKAGQTYYAYVVREFNRGQMNFRVEVELSERKVEIAHLPRAGQALGGGQIVCARLKSSHRARPSYHWTEFLNFYAPSQLEAKNRLVQFMQRQEAELTYIASVWGRKHDQVIHEG